VSETRKKWAYEGNEVDEREDDGASKVVGQVGEQRKQEPELGDHSLGCSSVHAPRTHESAKPSQSSDGTTALTHTQRWGLLTD
jgi:hypothetical protein